MDTSPSHSTVIVGAMVRARTGLATAEDVQELLQSIKGRVDRLYNETAGTVQQRHAESLQDWVINLAMDNNKGVDRSQLAVVATMIAAKAGVIAQDTYGSMASLNAKILTDEARALVEAYATSTKL